ncbi:MAG TPA: hypothetical protein VGJ20_36465 [Xanthobacteraceae bacterium]|jgi:hypothetical protein
MFTALHGASSFVSAQALRNYLTTGDAYADKSEGRHHGTVTAGARMRGEVADGIFCSLPPLAHQGRSGKYDVFRLTYHTQAEAPAMAHRSMMRRDQIIGLGAP